MTRREEIEKVANEFYKGDEVSTFVVAAQWADKTMIEKACEWLYKELNSGDNYYDWDKFLGDFRKAMEE